MDTMKARRTLVLIKSVHSLAFLAELAAIGWLVVSGLLGRRDRTVALAAVMVAAESGVFIANRGVCPLTPLAERYGAAKGSVSDIFLPDLVARTIPIWSTTLLSIAVGLHARGAWQTRNRRTRLHGRRTTWPMSPASSGPTAPAGRASHRLA